MERQPSTPLRGLRVIDLTTELGTLACRFLSGLGASVTRVESSTGDPLRRKPPTATGISGEPVSLYWMHMMAGRNPVQLDLDTSAGTKRLLNMLESADILIESQPIGFFESLGLGYEELHQRFPQLIWTSITPFGRVGPRAHWAATDLIGMAAGGLMSLCGDPDRPPLRVSVEQGYAQAGVAALVGSLAAVHARTATGLGQLVDVSMQEAVSNCLGNSRLYYEFDGVLSRRAGGSRAYEERGTRLVYPCRDGYVAISRAPDTPQLLHQWMLDGGLHPHFDPIEWASFSQAGLGMPSVEKTRELEGDLIALFATRPRMQLYEEGQRRGVMICPVSTPADLLRNDQLRDRGFFVEKRFDEFDRTVKVPGPPARMSASPWQEPTTPIEDSPPRPRQTPSPSSPPASGSKDATDILAGIRVADFSWVGVGPLATQLLGYLGAEVVHVESASRLDALRSGGPKRGTGPDASAYFANFNREKLGMTLNLHRPGAREVALRLARQSDVLVESFRPGFMPSVGLSYEDIRQANPSIIMMSCSMEGATGPHSGFRGFGLTLQATAGITHFTGWPDRQPVGTGTAYTDWFATSVAAAFLLAAIEHRRKTGEGQYIDLSQLEACIWALDAEVLRYTLTGAEGGPLGNRHPEMSPHGVFPCEGSDQWIALSVRDERDWRALASLLNDPAFGDAELLSQNARRAAEDRIEAAIGAWSINHNKHALAQLLQSRGIPAYAVCDMGDVQCDPHLRSRGHFWRTAHPVIGEADWDAPAFRFSETQLHPSKPAPLLGQHNEHIYGELLGYQSEEIAELAAAGVLE